MTLIDLYFFPISVGVTELRSCVDAAITAAELNALRRANPKLAMISRMNRHYRCLF